MAVDPTPAMREGMAAKAAGKTVSANPYRAGSQESADWLAGYVHDEREQNLDRPEPGEG
ncbi:ribosome modulation factor [Methylobacterium nigriterrae]|uniref:ribosome modulation factor n=1 Tax=Methylobacterium nigriterrae TaxID=3127512 RepID=UPI0030138268